jgi:hypothetical protein
MRKRICKQVVVVFVLMVTALFSLPAQNAAAGSGGVAQSDGKGKVNLLWLPRGEEWPAGGWQIQNSNGKVLVARVAAGEEGFLSGLAPEKARGIRDLAKGLPPFKDAYERKNYFFGLRFAILSDIALARALGFSRTLDHVASGLQAYRIVGLDAAGKPTALVLNCPAVDAAIATPLPSGPNGFRAESMPEGVLLFWTSGPEQVQAPVFYYQVERSGASGAREAVSRSPILLNSASAPDQPSHVDNSAPVEQEITYSLYGVDIFGRRSPAVEYKVFHGDFSALVAPADIKADGLKGRVTLSWTPNPSPNTSRVYIERSYSQAGTYVAITPKGLSREVKIYDDTTVPGGVTTFYRLRSVGPRNNPGEPSLPVSARPLNIAPPDAPRNLTSEVGRTRVRLTWEPCATAVAAYILERKTGKSGWTRINAELAQETQYDDPLGEEGGGTVSYRVKGVAFDNQEGSYSKAIDVVLPEWGLPPVPRITAVDTKDGKANVHFKPGWPEAKTSQFLVLRSGSPDVWGVVLGRPLAAEVRTYVDPFVAAGESYWYRVIAVNSRNDRSDPSDAVVITVGTPPIPTPAALRLEKISEPFSQVKILFTAPPMGKGLVAVCERKQDGDALWIRLSGVTGGNELLDSNLPAMGKLFYRVIYLAPNGSAGEPSPTTELVR